METRIYRSGISWGLFIPLFFVLATVGTVMVMTNFPAGLLFLALPLLLLWNTIRNTYYIIEGSVLTIKSGILYHKKIEIGTIKSIAKTSSILSSPAASMKDRIEIRFNKWDVVIISPKEKQEFIGHLLQINPEISLKPNFKKL